MTKILRGTLKYVQNINMKKTTHMKEIISIASSQRLVEQYNLKLYLLFF